jgi:hypothetical protein
VSRRVDEVDEEGVVDGVPLRLGQGLEVFLTVSGDLCRLGGAYKTAAAKEGREW